MDPQEELADLQNRFQLLEGDRKAFYEQSQITLKHNKQVADQLRQENKDFRQALTALHRERCSSGSVEGQALHEAELGKVEAQLTLLRQRHNALTSANRAKENQLAMQARSREGVAQPNGLGGHVRWDRRDFQRVWSRRSGRRPPGATSVGAVGTPSHSGGVAWRAS